MEKGNRSPSIAPGRGVREVSLLSQEKAESDENSTDQEKSEAGQDPHRPFNDKDPINRQGQNIKIVSLNTQGRKLEECVKYIEDHNTDILCVQESKIPSNSFFRYKDYICITSTDLKGGRNLPRK